MYQKLLLQLLALLFIQTTVQGQCCTYYLVMRDSYGDGWNGGSLQVKQNQNSIGMFSATNYWRTDSFTLCNNDNLQLIYTAGSYENENTYQLYDTQWNLIFADGPTPQTGSVLNTTASCNSTLVNGSFSCTAIPVDTVCQWYDNTTYNGSALAAGCANYTGKDIWFKYTVPASGSIHVMLDSGSIYDTGMALWRGNKCSKLTLVDCDDDGGNGYYSQLSSFNLVPQSTVYIQVWGYGNNQGNFKICITNPGKLIADSSALPIVLINTLGNTIVNDVKVDATIDIKYQNNGSINYLSDSSYYTGKIGIEKRGASSAGYPQTPYGFELRDTLNNEMEAPLFNMPAESDWNLISNYNDRSLLRNHIAFKLFENMGNYSVRTKLVEVMVDSMYRGIYLLTEKIKRDKNRVNIAKLTTIDTSGNDVTGGYILQQNHWDAFTSFQSNYSPVGHPTFDVHFVYEYPKPDSITAQQRTYIASYVDSLETALYSTNFADPINGYRKYLDVPSFIDYFIVNELARNNDGFKKSVFFNKDKNTHYSKLKMGPVWDFDWAFKNIWGCNIFESTDGTGWAHHINDCPTDNYSCGWYIRLLQDSTFANQLHCTYENYRSNILDTSAIFSIIDSVHTLVANVQQRHFLRWPILGISGPAPEVNAIAATYAAELDTLKAWLTQRISWLDANLPGLCNTASINPVKYNSVSCYPNPGNGTFYFANLYASHAWLSVYNLQGALMMEKHLTSNHNSFTLKQPGFYLYKLLIDGNTYTGKIINQ